jgi:hypothetical protein
MALNTGTLISAAIRPVDSLDTIATAYASEVKGGLHTVSTSTDRDNIIFERREWGMMCYVVADNKTYQLKYNYISTDIMNNSNWVEFSGASGGGSSTEWLDSVKSILGSQPGSPVNGDRYLISSSPSGVVWSGYPDHVAQWNSVTSNWDMTIPTDGMSVRVDNEDESIYKYEGVYPSGVWKKERLNQIFSIEPTTSNGLSYSVTTSPTFSSYQKDMMFLTKFSSSNIGSTVSININSLGSKLVKKPTSSGLSGFYPNDIEPGLIYNLTYDGTYFQLNRPYVNEDLFNVKYYVEPTDYIVVPQNYQYWVYGGLEIAGTLINYGQVVIANGSLILSGGTFSGMPGSNLVLLTLTSGATTSYNDTDTIQFSYVDTILGPSVSAIVKDVSLTASKLDTGSNGGATAGYFLSVDSSGDFAWIQNTPSGVETFDDKNFVMSIDILGDGEFTGFTISHTPVLGCYIGAFVNGQECEVGYGSTNSSPFYFSNDGGATSRSNTSPNNVQVGDGLYWNSSIGGVGLYTTWRISLFYLTQ